MSASDVAAGSMAGAVVFSMVSDVLLLMLLFRRSGRVVCGCWEDCLVFGLLDDCLGFADAFGCVLVAILAVTLVFGRETGFVVSAILEIHYIVNSILYSCILKSCELDTGPMCNN